MSNPARVIQRRSILGPTIQPLSLQSPGSGLFLSAMGPKTQRDNLNNFFKCRRGTLAILFSSNFLQGHVFSDFHSAGQGQASRPPSSSPKVVPRHLPAPLLKLAAILHPVTFPRRGDIQREAFVRLLSQATLHHFKYSSQILFL